LHKKLLADEGFAPGTNWGVCIAASHTPFERKVPFCGFVAWLTFPQHTGKEKRDEWGSVRGRGMIGEEDSNYHPQFTLCGVTRLMVDA